MKIRLLVCAAVMSLAAAGNVKASTIDYVETLVPLNSNRHRRRNAEVTPWWSTPSLTRRASPPRESFRGTLTRFHVLGLRGP